MSLTREDIVQAYRLLLNREPSEQEIAHRAGHAQAGLPALRNAFFASDEFARKYAAFRERIDTERTATLIYLDVPGTLPFDLSEILAAWPTLQPGLALHENGPAELAKLPIARRRTLRYVYGDLAADAGAALDLPHSIACVLRLPGPRLFELYGMIARSGSVPQATDFGAFLDWSVEAPAYRLELDNGQVRRLAGRVDPAGFGDEMALLRRALRTALSETTLLGLTEHFDAFPARLAQAGNLDTSEIPGAGDMARPDPAYDAALAALTPAQRAIFDAYVMWDTYLYDVCAQIVLPATPAPETDTGDDTP